MTPKASQGGRATGTSFKGVFQYLQHDKRQEGETVRDTTDRVDWQEFRNLMTDDSETAWRIMAATSRQQDELKRQAGQSLVGNKSDKVVFHYSLGWHPDEKDGLTKDEMLRAADESIKALGAGPDRSFFRITEIRSGSKTCASRNFSEQKLKKKPRKSDSPPGLLFFGLPGKIPIYFIVAG